MPAAHHDTVIERGATWSLGLQYPQGDPIDLSTGWASLSLGSYQTFSWTVAPAHGYDHLNLYQYGGGLAQTCYANAQRQGQMDCYLDPATMAAGIYVGCLFSGWNGAQLACDSTFTVTP